MLNWAFGDEKEREEADKLKIKLATPSIKILVNFNKVSSFLIEFISCVATSWKPLLPSPNEDVKPILLRGIRAGIFFIELAERIIGPIEIDQYFSPGHWFDREIAPLWVGLCL